MRFKLDENLGSRTLRLFLDRRHDAATVRDEGLSGSADETLFQICAREGRCLVTLDLDFADVIRFPPRTGPGVVVLHPPGNPSLPMLENMVSRFLDHADLQSLPGSLWIVQPSRIRIYEPADS